MKENNIFNSEYIKSWEQIIPDYCKGCSLFDECGGGCRGASEQIGKTIHEVDPFVIEALSSD